MLTRKHFKIMAAHISEMNSKARKARNQLLPEVAETLEHSACYAYRMVLAVNDNPRFNQSKFREACKFST